MYAFHNVFKVKQYSMYTIVSASLLFCVLTVNFASTNYGLKSTTICDNVSEVTSNVNKKIDELYEKYKSVRAKCVVPFHIDPFDVFTKTYLKRNLHLNCSKAEQLTFVDYDNGLLKLSKSVSQRNLRCYYSFITRGHSDLNVVHSKARLLTKTGVNFTNKNYVANVSCYAKSAKTGRWSRPKYRNTHLWIPDLIGSPKSEDKVKEEKPNIFILVIESLSRNSYIRFMKKTQSAMKSLQHFTVLDGLTKVEMNSFPNSMALIAGDAVTDKKYRTLNRYWDNNLDYLWKRYKKNGYVTAFVEDLVNIGLFNYVKSGFRNPPTDFFPRPFWLQQYVVDGWNLHEAMTYWRRYCLGKHGSKIEAFLSHLFEFVRKMKRTKQNYFMYSFFSQMTHEDFNHFQLIDDYVAAFLNEMKPYMSNTLFLLVGDHGPRFGPMVDTPLGRLEERLPLCAIRIPELLHAKYPHLRKVLELNKQSLLSWYDIHRLMYEVNEGEFNFDPKPNNSILNPARQLVSPDRTCDQAKIVPFYCVCNNRFQVNSDIGWHEWWAGVALTKIVNSWIRKSCDVFQMDKNTFAEVHLPINGHILSNFERVNVSVKMKNLTFTLNAMMKRTTKQLNRNWSPWMIDTEFTDPELLKKEVLKNYCFRNLTKRSKKATNK